MAIEYRERFHALLRGAIVSSRIGLKFWRFQI
jgi:hypothetical protein